MKLSDVSNVSKQPLKNRKSRLQSKKKKKKKKKKNKTKQNGSIIVYTFQKSNGDCVYVASSNNN